jgi:ribA/ribD-fused uncharacterized protein
MASPILIQSGRDPLSNYCYTPFTVDGLLFLTVEQYLQVQKAKIYGANGLVPILLSTRSPKRCNQMGSDVDRINPAKWAECQERVLYRGLSEKFNQNVAARNALLATGEGFIDDRLGPMLMDLRSKMK